ncbi:MAG TPA: tetratricopeptide repeat protein [Labilithrix sp.]
MLATWGCTGNKGGSGPNAQSPERQSDAEYDLARDMFAKGNPRAALDHAQKAVSLNDENEKANYMVSVIYLSFCSTDRGYSAPDCRLDEAEKFARASVKANPQFRDGTNLLAQVLIDEKKCPEAIQAIEPLTRDAAYVFPNLAWGNLGWAQVCAGQIDAGIASLRNSVSAEPRFCVGHYRLGVALEKKGDLPSAEQSFTNAITADPQCEGLQDAWEARCGLRMRLGKMDDARKDCEKCKEISVATTTGKACEQRLQKLPAASGPQKAPASGSAASTTP